MMAWAHETYLSYASISSISKDRMSFSASSFLCPNSQCMILSSSIALQSVSDARRVSCHAATCCPLHPELFKPKLWGNCELTQRQRLHTRLDPDFSPKFHVDTALLAQLPGIFPCNMLQDLFAEASWYDFGGSSQKNYQSISWSLEAGWNPMTKFKSEKMGAFSTQGTRRPQDFFPHMEDFKEIFVEFGRTWESYLAVIALWPMGIMSLPGINDSTCLDQLFFMIFVKLNLGLRNPQSNHPTLRHRHQGQPFLGPGWNDVVIKCACAETCFLWCR